MKAMISQPMANKTEYDIAQAYGMKIIYEE